MKRENFTPKLKKAFRSFLSAGLLLLTVSVSAQVTGVVTDRATGEPLIGASILIKGTTTGTVTDVDGSYSIAAKEGDVFQVSYTGFTAIEVTVGATPVLNIALDEGVLIDEVVVTGYTTTKKKDFSGAVSLVKAAELKAVPSGNVEQQLQGRVSGVTVVTNGQPGTTNIIRVRGFGALGGNQPLYIVDGQPVGSTDFLNPDDIESTTVLKDAASASIYGARAANGVIVYTTKKGSKNSRKVNITYDGLFGFTDPNVAGAPKMLSPQEQADWTHIAYRNNAAATGTEVKYNHPQYGTQAQATLPDYLHANGANGVRGSVDVEAIKAAAAANPGTVFLIKPNLAGTDWYDEITRTAGLMRHSLGFSGGGENSRFYVSLGAQNQDGILLENKFKRYSLRANMEYNLTNRLRFGQNVQFTYRSVVGQEGGSGGIGIADDESTVLSAYRMPSVIPVFDELGQYASTRAAGFNNPRNPVRSRVLNTQNDRTFNMNGLGNLYLELDVIKGLVLRSSVGGDFGSNFFKNYNYRYLGDSEPEASNSFSEGSQNSFGWVNTNTATYNFKVGNHGFSVLAGAEFLNTGKGRFINGSGLNPFSTDLDYVNLNVVQSPTVNSGLFSGVNFESLFGKVDYNLNDKYYISATVRRDGSSRFGINNRYGVFPAFAAAWRVTGEDFLRANEVLTDLKIRGGWGQMGNSNNVDPANQYSLYAANRGNSFYPIEGQNSGVNEGYYRSRIGNPDAKWETSTTINVGFDATLFDGKWEIVGDLWKKKTDDLLYTVPLPGVVGSFAAAPAVNIAKMNNSGFDLLVINRGKISSNWNYDVSWTSSFLKNEITYLAPNVTFFGGNAYRGVSPIRNAVGQPLSSFFGYKVLGYFKDAADVANSPAQVGKGVGRFKYEDINGDGKIDPTDRTFIGNPVPKYTGGLVFNASWKNLTIGTYLYTSLGNKIFNFSKWFTDFFGSFEGSGKGERAKESWTPALGDKAKAPIWESASNVSTNAGENSWYVEDGSYLRMQYLSIGYALPTSLIKPLGLSKVNLTLAGTNIFTITKYQGLDPGVGGDVDTNFGVDVGNYPVTRGMTLGINVGF
ncbi:MAG TPA: SusC/RagA family TonB-linked outer membrane protein [Saprospiraceae bacterium]|nr:SusC/RagA family TonB-linked outer membrane protein [Saprospiraceae bacterium]HNT18862.1 SusC/RagA family TonB-linked outer membrane protein [Saprospiraceae bacterium]